MPVGRERKTHLEGNTRACRHSYGVSENFDRKMFAKTLELILEFQWSINFLSSSF